MVRYKKQTLLKRWYSEKDAVAAVEAALIFPILLTLLCLEFEDSGGFPNDLAELYRRAINTLLRKWDAKRGIYRDAVYKNLSTQRKEDLLLRLISSNLTIQHSRAIEQRVV